MHCPICGAACKYILKHNKQLQARSIHLWNCPAGHGCIVDNCWLTYYSDDRHEGRLLMFRTIQRAKAAMLGEQL